MINRRPIALVLSEDGGFLDSAGESLSGAGFRVARFSFAEAAVEFIRNSEVSVAVVRSAGPGADSAPAWLKQIQAADRELPVVTSDGRSGPELLTRVCGAAAWRTSEKRRPPAPEPATHEVPMVGESALMRNLRENIARIAACDSNVLITGETGTGKELAAALVHANSRRRAKPFVCVNCAALPDSLVESELFGYERGAFTGAVSARDGQLKLAEGGSVFLDEIGDISQYAQAKLLRVIDNKQMQPLGGGRSMQLNVRFIAATNRPLRQMVGEGRFREDLYFRLDVARIHVPPLRERREDIPLLLLHYVREMNARFERDAQGFTEEAAECLTRYDWPGNIRELRNLLEGIYVNLPDRKVSLLDLPERIRRPFEDAAHGSYEERERLLSTLLETKWNKSKAAEKLHWSRMTLYRKLAKYHLTA
jgi:two-component system response regulator HydG/two-component system response regulator AtoC